MPLLAVSLVLVSGIPARPDLLWGAGAGVAGFLGLVMLYRSLSTGAMAVAAPITAVTAALVPILTGLLLGETPSPLAMTGVACAVVAIGLVSAGPRSDQPISASLVGLALGAGVMFGLFFVLIAQSADAAGMWPLAGARAASVLLGLAALAVTRTRLIPIADRAARGVWGWVVLGGLGDIAANALYLVAVRHGLISVVAPIAALYPVSTVLLALAVDREHVRPVQVAGLGLAAAALVLTAV